MFGPNVTLLRAEIHEASGNREAAAESYNAFLRLWQHADSTLQYLNDRARAGLARVASEPAN